MHAVGIFRASNRTSHSQTGTYSMSTSTSYISTANVRAPECYHGRILFKTKRQKYCTLILLFSSFPSLSSLSSPPFPSAGPRPWLRTTLCWTGLVWARQLLVLTRPNREEAGCRRKRDWGWRICMRYGLKKGAWGMRCPPFFLSSRLLAFQDWKGQCSRSLGNSELVPSFV